MLKGEIKVKNRRMYFIAMIGLLILSVGVGTAIAAFWSDSNRTNADPKDGDVKYLNILPDGRTTPYPTTVDYQEINESEARDFFERCSESLGFTSTYSADISVQKMFFINQGCNAYEVISDSAIMKIRTSDFTVLDLQAKNYYDPLTKDQIPMISQEQAQKTAEEDWAKIKASEESAREQTLGISRSPSEYKISTTQLIHNCDMDLWQTTFEKTGPSMLPGESSGGSMLLRADGLLVSLVVSEVEGCKDTEPKISETAAISIASEIINTELAELKKWHTEGPDAEVFQNASLPTSATLGYVVPNWCYSAQALNEVKSGLTMVPEQKSRLAWIVEVPGIVQVNVDAITGEILGGGGVE